MAATEHKALEKHNVIVRIERGTKIAASLAVVAAAVYGWWQYEDWKRQVRIDRSIDFSEKYETDEMKGHKDTIDAYSSNGGFPLVEFDALVHITKFFEDAYGCVKYEYCDEKAMLDTLGQEAEELWNRGSDIMKRPENGEASFLFNLLYAWPPLGTGKGLECIKNEFDCEDYGKSP